MNKIAVVTGSRSEYGILKRLLRLFESDNTTELFIIATGSHLSYKFGNTFKEIQDDGFKIYSQVKTLIESDKKSDVARSISNGILGITVELEKINPHFVVILGDRFEIFAAAIAAIHSNSILVHIHGGDMGNAIFDDYYRNAITQMAQIHFTASKKSLETVLMMGANPSNTFLVGSPTQDDLTDEITKSRSDLCGIYNLEDGTNWVLMVHHPIEGLIQSVNEFNNIITSLTNIQDQYNLQIILIYPNADVGSGLIIESINKLENNSRWFIHKNLPRNDYAAIMKNVLFMIGNSSSGIIEAPVFGTPVVNVGIRQQGREKGGNVVNVKGDDVSKIQDQISQFFEDPSFSQTVRLSSSLYGDGKASIRIMNKLKTVSNLIESYPPTFYNNLDLTTRLQQIANLDYDKFGQDGLTASEIIEKFG